MSGQGFQTSHALVIGVDAYRGGIAPLTTAVRDARGVARLLADAQGYEVATLLDEQATRAALLQALEVDLPARLGPDDRVLIYYAGHGAALDGDDGPEGFLLPQDAQGDTSTLLPMARVAAAVRALPCRHVLLVLDCCFAGAFRWSSMRSFAPRPTVLYRRRYERFVSDRAAQVLTSAAANQKALDVFDGLTIGQRPVVAGHSPFAAALIAGLNGAADVAGPSGEADGVITANELYQYVRDVVEGATEERGALQTPGLWPLPGHGRGEYVFRTDGPLVLPEDPRLDPGANPWRGLEAYGAEHAALFFGREAAIAEIVGRVEAAPLVCVLGASGVGKSSVVQAGVLPRLQRAGYALIGPVRPGSEPLATLGPALAAARAATAPTVLVLDQFEEMFTACRAPAERAAVLGLIAELVETTGKTRVVLTLRADFEAAFLATPLGPAIQAARCPVGAMTREALRQVVLGPADERALYFEPPTLVDRLVEDVALVPGGLPLLSFALSELYLRAVDRGEDDRTITEADYEAIGRVAGCLRRRAESLYVATDEAGRHALRRVLLRMIALEGGGVARRRVSLAELRAVDPEEDAQVEARLGDLTDARLLVRAPGHDGDPTFEPAHEALVLGWDRLVGWLDAEAAVLPLQRAVWRAARDWRDAGEPRGRLWNDDPRLPQARSLTEAQRNPVETRFLAASERWRLTRRRRGRALVATVLVTALVAAVGGVWLAGKEAAARRDAEAATDAERVARTAAQRSATAERLAKDDAQAAQKEAVSALGQARTQAIVATAAGTSDGGLAALLLAGLPGADARRGAYEAALGLDAMELPLAVLTTLEAPVAGVAFSEDGGRVVAWAPPRAEVIEVATGLLVGAATWPGLDAARLSPAGDLLYLIHENGQIRSVKVAGEVTLPALPPAAEAAGAEVGWDWPAWDPRHSHVVVHPAGAVALADPRVGWTWGMPRPARGLVASPTGFWRSQASAGGAVTLERLDPAGAVLETIALPAPRVRAACGVCPGAPPPPPDATEDDLLGDDVVGIAVSPDGAEIALVTGGDFNSYAEDGSVGCGASVCVLRRAPGDRLVRDGRRSVRWRDVIMGDPQPGFASLALHADGVRGCLAAFGHGALNLSGEGFIDGLSLRRDQADRGRCRLLPTPTEVAVAITGVDGAVWVRGGSGRRLAGPSFITATALNADRLVTGHVDGGVRLWTRTPRAAVGAGWRPTDGELPDGPEDAWLAGPRDDRGAARGRLGSWRSGGEGLVVDAPTATTLPLERGVRPQDNETIGVSPDHRLARVRLGPLGYVVWPLEPPGRGLRVPPLPCVVDPSLSPEDVWRFDPERPYLLKQCDAGLFEAPATWAAVKGRLAGVVRGCLSVRQRVDLLGETEEEAGPGAAACRSRSRPLPAVAAPTTEVPPEEPPVDSDPLPAIATAAPDADRARDAQALNVQGMRALGRGDRVGAAELFEAAVRLDPALHLARYNLACMYALIGRDEDALDILAAFEAAGCDDCRARVARAGTDPDWEGLRDDPRFVRLTGQPVP